MKFVSRLMLVSCLLLSSGLSRGQYLTYYPNAATYRGVGGFYGATAFAVDSRGNTYVATDYINNIVHKITPAGVVTNYAGRSSGSTGLFGVDSVPAITMSIGRISSMAVDGKGNLYMVDYDNEAVLRVDTNGYMQTIAGGFSAAGWAYWFFLGDTIAIHTFLNRPAGVACDKVGNVYITQVGNGRVRKIASGYIHTIAGNGVIGYSGDGGLATAANLTLNGGIAVDTLGNIYLAGTNCRKIGTDGIIRSIAGNGIPGYTGDGGPATNASINATSVAVDHAGNVYLSCTNNGSTGWQSGVVRMVNASGIISTVSGGGTNAPQWLIDTPGTGCFRDTSVALGHRGGIQTDAAGDLFFLDTLSGYVYKSTFNNNGPHFEFGIKPEVTICENSGVYSLNNLLTVDDAAGSTVHWTPTVPPAHGALVGTYTAVSTAAPLVPSGLSYTPAVGFYGRDSMVVSVFDGVYTIRDTIKFVVNPMPSAGTIIGDSTICADSVDHTYQFSLPSTQGYWGLGGIAALDTYSATKAFVLPSTTGTGILTYSNGCGTLTRTIGVNPKPVISGGAVVCVGDTLHFTATGGSGVWSASGGGISVTSLGQAVGLSTGADTVIFTAPGCTVSLPVQVGFIDSFSADTGFCAGTNLVLYYGTGNTWSSSNPYMVTINATSSFEQFNFNYAGLDTITASNLCGSFTTIVTVNPMPDTIGLAGAVFSTSSAVGLCTGTTYVATDLTPGGIWSVTGTAETIDSSGHFKAFGMGTGMGQIRYTTHGSCTSTLNFKLISRNVLPSWDTSICVGQPLAVMLNDSCYANYPAGYAVHLTCSQPGAMVSFLDSLKGYMPFYQISNLIPGLVNIAYSNGCATWYFVSTVNPLPAVPSVSPTICAGGTTTATDATGGGTWGTSFGNLSVTSGGVLSTVAGTWDNVIYTLPTGCYNSAPVHITTVSPLPIAGNTGFCVGETLNLVDSTPGGTWASSNTAVVSNLLLALSAGTATITYSNGCGSVTKTITVYPNPAPIAGPDSVCLGSATLYTDISPGGTWSVTGSGSITSGGTYTPGTSGWDLINYTLPTGCVYSQVVDINAPATPLVAFSDSVFCGNGLHPGFADSAIGGHWTSSNHEIALPDTSLGNVLVNAFTQGIVTFSYNVTNACGSFTTNKTVTIYPIAGNTYYNRTICTGVTYDIYEADSTGIWNVRNGFAALDTPHYFAGHIVGVSPGIDTMTYTDSNVCGASVVYNITKVMGVTPIGPISGPSSVCVGTSTSYSDPTPGGWWGGGSGVGVGYFYAVGTTGTLYTSSPGVTTINYSVSGMCGTATTLKTVTVYPSNGISIDSIAICEGRDTLLPYTLIPLQTWINYDSTATIIHISDTGAVVKSLIPTRDTVDYRISSTCGVHDFMHILLINPYLPHGPITGDSVVCTGSAITLSDSTLAGTWSSSAPVVASVAAGGVVHGVATGTAIITATATNACGTVTLTKSLTVDPAAFTGIIDSTRLCLGAVHVLHDSLAGALWTTFNSDVTILSTATGTATIQAMAAGVDTVYRTITTVCGTVQRKHVVTVANPVTVGAITGAGTVCVGATTSLADTPSGGVWVSSDTTIAKVAGTGVVTGIGAGVATITYRLYGGCDTSTAVTTVTVNPLAGSSTFDSLDLCDGISHIYPDSMSGGTWSTAFGIATVIPGASSGAVSATAAGVDTVYYTVTSSCGTAVYKHMVRFLPVITAAAITGSATVCTGSSTTLADATAGGTWASSNTGVATISSGGLLTGVSVGIATITYKVHGPCDSSSATLSITVFPTPAPATFDSLDLCDGLTHIYADPLSGGTWSTAFGIATVIPGSGSGAVSATTAGVDTVYYTVSSSCGIAVYKHMLRFLPIVTAAAITGSATVCTGSSTTLADATAGGIWTSSNAGVATISSSGLLTGVSAGAATITYKVHGLCDSSSATLSITVFPTPAPATFDSADLCISSIDTYYAPVPGGTWTTAFGAVTVTVGTGHAIVSATVPVTDTVYYTVTSTCGTVVYKHFVRFLPILSAGTVSGSLTLCAGSSGLLSETPAGGFWSSTSSVVSVSAGGTVSGVTTGTGAVTYTVGNVCNTVTATATITVLPTGYTTVDSQNICPGSTVTITATPPGGTWSVTNGHAGFVTLGAASRLVDGISSGRDTVIYSKATVCGFIQQSHIINVVADTPLGPILGDSSLCEGTTISLSNATPGGVWGSYNTGVATAFAGIVTGVASGVAEIYYLVVNACGEEIATKSITVNLAGDYIEGTYNLCVGSATTLSPPLSGGTWTVANAGLSGTAVGGNIAVTGIDAGVDTVVYYAPSVCLAEFIYIYNVTADTVLPPISGDSTLCPGTIATLVDSVSGGVWTSSVPTVASITSTGGVLAGLGSGTTVITYQAVGICGYLQTATKTVAVEIPPSFIVSGPDSLCAGSTAAYATTGSGGTWSMANGLAIGTTGTGIYYMVSGINPGWDSVVYTEASFCGAVSKYRPVYIAPVPNAGVVVGPDTLCAGAAVAMSASISGGTWSATNGNAAVNAGGMATYVVSGADTVQYTITGFCGSATATHVVYCLANPGVAPITGIATLCTGSTITLADTTMGGTWLESNVIIGLTPMGTSTGATGLVPGTDTVWYVSTSYCGHDTATAVLNVPATPTSEPIVGTDSICLGATVTWTDGYPGGAWTRSNNLATVAGGIISGNAVGVDTIAYSFANACGSFSVSQTITVLTAPSVGVLTGPSEICAGTAATYTDTAAGGVWTATAGVAIASGIVTAPTAGTDTIHYTIANLCGSSVAMKIVGVDTVVHPTISGDSLLCKVGTDTLSVYPVGGILSLTNSHASILGGTVLTGNTFGTDTAMYSYPDVCGADTATFVFKVDSFYKCDTPGMVRGVEGAGKLITLQPNPSTGIYHATLSVPAYDIHVLVTDLTGRAILEAAYTATDHWDIDIHDQARGTYLISITADGVQWNGKLVLW